MPIFEPTTDVSLSNANFEAWRKKAEKEDSINRFAFIPFNKRLTDTWVFKRNFKQLPVDEVFIIKMDKFVNRPDMISYQVYKDPSLWWIIAMTNDIIDPLTEFHMGRKLNIPSLSHIKRVMSR